MHCLNIIHVDHHEKSKSRVSLPVSLTSLGEVSNRQVQVTCGTLQLQLPPQSSCTPQTTNCDIHASHQSSLAHTTAEAREQLFSIPIFPTFFPTLPRGHPCKCQPAEGKFQLTRLQANLSCLPRMSGDHPDKRAMFRSLDGIMLACIE